MRVPLPETSAMPPSRLCTVTRTSRPGSGSSSGSSTPSAPSPTAGSHRTRTRAGVRACGSAPRSSRRKWLPSACHFSTPIAPASVAPMPGVALGAGRGVLTGVPAVSRLNVTPVKGLALQHPASIDVGATGVDENRRFYLTDAAGRMFNGKRDGRLVQVAADYDHASGHLALRFPDGAVADGAVAVGEAVETSFYGRPVAGRLVEGPWSAALSRFAGTELRLVRAEDGLIACDVHPVTLLSA